MIKSTASKRRSAKLQVQERRQMHYKIDIRPLKAFTAEKLPRSWPLRKALLTQKETHWQQRNSYQKWKHG